MIYFKGWSYGSEPPGPGVDPAVVLSCPSAVEVRRLACPGCSFVRNLYLRSPHLPGKQFLRRPGLAEVWGTDPCTRGEQQGPGPCAACAGCFSCPGLRIGNGERWGAGDERVAVRARCSVLCMLGRASQEAAVRWASWPGSVHRTTTSTQGACWPKYGVSFCLFPYVGYCHACCHSQGGNPSWPGHLVLGVCMCVHACVFRYR